MCTYHLIWFVASMGTTQWVEQVLIEYHKNKKKGVRRERGGAEKGATSGSVRRQGQILLFYASDSHS